MTNRGQYLEDHGWRWHSGKGAHSYWIRPDSHGPLKKGKIYIRRFAVQIQRGYDHQQFELQRISLDVVKVKPYTLGQ